jgi:hypothetical protein
MLGVAHHSLSTVRMALNRCTEPESYQILGPGDEPREACVHVIMGVKTLRVLGEKLNKIRSATIIIDSVPALQSVKGIKMLDSDGPGWSWSPRPIRMSVLRDCLQDNTKPTVMEFVESKVLEDLKRETTSGGVLDKVLNYAQKAGDGSSRDRIHRSVAEYLSGRINLAKLREQTRFADGHASESHENMIEGLSGPRGKSLSEALVSVGDGMDPIEAASKYGVDVFEIRYSMSTIRKLEAKTPLSSRCNRDHTRLRKHTR